MKDEQLLEEIAIVVRAENAAAESALEDFAAGRIAEAEVRARLAGEPGLDALIEACRPLGQSVRDSIVERLLDVSRSGGTSASPWKRFFEKLVGRGGDSGRAREGWLGWQMAGAAAALAAAVVAVVLVRSSAAPLPPYTASFRGGDALMRGDEPVASATLAPDSRLEWVIRPERAVEGPVAVRGFLVRDGQAQPWQPSVDISTQGTVRVAGRPRELGIPDGRSLLVVVVGRRGSLPESFAEVEPRLVATADDEGGVRAAPERGGRAADAPGGDWVAFSHPVHVRE